MNKYKCIWNINATAEEYPANIPTWLPEFMVMAEDEAHALYQYEKHLLSTCQHPNPKYFNEEYAENIEKYLSRPFASGGWGLFANKIK